jgi:hypothetical protein
MRIPLIRYVKDILECEVNPQHFPMAAEKIKAYYGQDAIEFFNPVNEFIGNELDDDASDKDVCVALEALGRTDEYAQDCLLDIFGGTVLITLLYLTVELLGEVTKEQTHASNN